MTGPFDLSRPLGELIRSGSTNNSYPLVIVCLAMLAAALFGLVAILPTGIEWLAAGVGTISAFGAIMLALNAGLRQPELLRSETHIERMRLLNMAADSDMPPESITQLLLPQKGSNKKTNKEGA